jgi:hypothetical protein
MRIRDIIDYESKRKGKRPEILREEEYMEQYFKAHSMHSQCGIEIEDEEKKDMKK